MLDELEQPLEEAAKVAKRAGLSIESELAPILQNDQGGLANITTGGHCNTDHIVTWTGDPTIDRIAEMKRQLLTRWRSMQPESKGEERWNKPKISGSRRRRIEREKDAPEAPPDPPPSGYVIYVGQCTTKWRHDHPNELHDQTRVVQEISKSWRIDLNDEERQYYTDFADALRQECKVQNLEFRATGVYTRSERFEKLQGEGPWIHKNVDERNALEQEICTYETVIFPPRPPEYNDDYEKRQAESRHKRKLKLKGLRSDDDKETSTATIKDPPQARDRSE